MRFSLGKTGAAILALVSVAIASPVGPFATSNSTTNGTALTNVRPVTEY